MSEFVLVSSPGVEYLTCASFRPPHAFTLRTAGFGGRDRGEADREVLGRALGLSRSAHMRQVHGADVRVAPDATEPMEADGLMTDAHGLGLVVHSADCVPLLFWAEEANAVAAVHSGWRGTLARIATRAVSALNEAFDVDPADLHVALGPAIRSCCFEVGDEVVQAFAESGREMSRIASPGPNGRDHLDLIEDNRMQLQAAGVSGARVYDSGRCTACENERFFSYRREGRGVGRVISMVGRLSVSSR